MMINGVEKLYCNSCYATNSIDLLEEEAEHKTIIYDRFNNFLKSKELKLCHLNVNGLFNKFGSIQILFTETLKNIHILGVTETHLNSVIDSSLLSVDGYTFIRKDRTSGAGGGVGCYIRNDLNWERRSDLETPEMEAIWIEIFQKNSSSLLISIMYRPPDSSKHLDQL